MRLWNERLSGSSCGCTFVEKLLLFLESLVSHGFYSVVDDVCSVFCVQCVVVSVFWSFCPSFGHHLWKILERLKVELCESTSKICLLVMLHFFD